MATMKDRKRSKSSTNASGGGKRTRQKTTAAAITTAENRRKAVQLRLSGLTFEEISDVMGLGNRGAAYALVRDALAATQQEIREDADRYVAEDLMRIERMIRAIWTGAIGRPESINPETGAKIAAVPPDLKAIDRVESLLARKSRLLGLDAPVRAELSGPGGAPVEVADATQRLIDRLDSIETARRADKASK